MPAAASLNAVPHLHAAGLPSWQAAGPDVPLDAVIEALPAGVVFVGPRGEVRRVNETARDLLGAVEEGEAWRLVAERSFAPRWDDGHDMTLVSGRRVHLGTRAMPGGAGQIITLTDVTETRHLQDLLERHQRASELGQVAATLAHQLRTPVASAMLNCGTLATVARGDTPAGRALSRMNGSLRRLERLVDNLLAFARGGALALEPVSAMTLTGWLTEDIAPLASDAFTVALPDASLAGAVEVNESALRSVLLNLAENARDITRGRGRLEIHAEIIGDELVLAFCDDGPGVPEAERTRIFEPFVSTRPNGTGLGLAVARTVVQAHGGRISCEQAPGGGGCFVVCLPIHTRTGTGDSRP
jgi:two-component system, sensor histidine kinase FlrB